MTEYRTVAGERLALARARLRAWRRRVTGTGLALRATILVAGLAAVLTANHSAPYGPALAVALSVMAMARPHGAWVWAVQLAAVLGWVLGTLKTDAPSLVLAFGIGAALHVHHATAALAAVTRADAAVDPAVLRGWAGRQAVVLAGAGVAAVVTAILAGRPMPVSPEALAVLAGLGALAVPVAIVASLSRR